MKRLSIFACAALLAFATSASAENERSSIGLRSFVGLWEGIDPADGGDALRSITCQREQSCELGVTDSVITLCGGGTAFASGTGSLEDGALVFPDVVLTCPGGGETVHLSVRYERDRFNRTLVETAVILAEDRTLPNIVFHKISR